MDDAQCPLLLNAKVVAYLILPRYECTMDGAMGPNLGIFSLATKVDPHVLMPLRDTEKALFDKALRMLTLSKPPKHLRDDV